MTTPASGGSNPNDLQQQFNQILQRLTALEVSQIHRQADTDSAQTALHHSLGISPQQASPGDHLHDARTSKPLYMGVVSGSRGGNVALANLLTTLANYGIITNSTVA